MIEPADNLVDPLKTWSVKFQGVWKDGAWQPWTVMDSLILATMSLRDAVRDLDAALKGENRP